MAASNTIIELSDSEIDSLIQLLLPMDEQLDKRVNFVMSQYSMGKSEALEYIVTDNPVLWAKVYLDWEAGLSICDSDRVKSLKNLFFDLVVGLEKLTICVF